MESRPVPFGTGRARGRSRGAAPAVLPFYEPEAPPGSARGPPPPGPSIGPGAGDSRGPPFQPEAGQRPAGGRGRADRRRGLIQGTPEESAVGKKQNPFLFPPIQRPGLESFDIPQQPSAQQVRGPSCTEMAQGPQGHSHGQRTGPCRVSEDEATGGVASQMGALDLHPGPRGEGLAGRRRGALSVQYLEQSYRPQSLVDKKGYFGQPCQVFANLFRLDETVSGITTVYQYHVDFSPEVPSKRIRISIINSLKALIGDVNITDGMLLFLPVRLENETTESVVTRPTDGAAIKITIRFSNSVDRRSNTFLQILNLLYKRMLQHIGLTLIQRNYFNPRMSVKIKNEKYELWPGYAAAIGLYENSVGLVVDVSHKFLSTQTVYDVIAEFEIRVANPEARRSSIVNALVGKIVLTRYNNKTYRIDDVDFNRHPSDSFERKDKTRQTFVEYYKNAYQATIRDLNQPLLISLPSKKDQRAGQHGSICLIPELCTITGIPEELRRTNNITRYTRIGPNERIQQLINLSSQINDNAAAKKELANWNVVLSNDVVPIAGHVFKREDVKMARGVAMKFEEKKADWSGELRSERFITPIDLEFGSWIFICPSICRDLAVKVFRMLQMVGGPLGMRIDEPRLVLMQDDRASSYVSSLRTNVNGSIKMVLIMLRNQRKDVYDAIKTYLCLEHPVPSQCLVVDKVNKPTKLKSVMTKVAIQMNCKMGGEIWALDIPLSKTMVVGIDTFHDSQKKRRSAVGLVASLNRTFTRYYTKCWLQSENEELGRGLNAGMQACLRKYHEVNGFLPERIFVFRDGVGDGMIPMVKSYEVEQLLRCFEGIRQDYRPMLSVIVVKKRMTTRLFVEEELGFANPPPGTVVDDVVTKPMWYDYYIVSQSVNQGTVSPTHYNVIHQDNDNFRPEYMQRLTYKLCHLYYNWPGTIRVPAPCQYAHKVASLVGQSLHREPHSSLCDKLFYL